MGATKRLIEEQEEYRQFVYNALLEMGAIATCEFHSNYYYETGKCEEQLCYGVVTNKAKKALGNNYNFGLLHKTIQDVLMDSGLSRDACPRCVKIKEE